MQYTNGVIGPISSEFTEATIHEGTASACFTIGQTASSLHGYVVIAADGSDREGFVHFSVSFVDPDLRQVPPIGLDVLATLDVVSR